MLSGFFKAILWLALALAFLLLGASVPVHFRAIAPSVVAKAGANSETVENLAQVYLDSGAPGPVKVLWEASAAEPSEAQRERLRTILKDHPDYRLTGGPAPYLEQFLSTLEIPDTGKVPGIIALLIPRQNRESLTGFLQQSSDSAVQCMLDSRELTTYTRFPLVSSPAGHPLDAAILTTALLLQGNHFEPEARRELSGLCAGAVEGDRQAVELLENFYLGMVSLAKRLDWVSLTEVVEHCGSIRVFADVAGLIHRDADDLPYYFAAVLLAEDPAALTGFFSEHPQQGPKTVFYALEHGEGALAEVLDFGKPLYESPGYLQPLQRVIEPVRSAFVGSAHASFFLAVVLKAFFLIAGGFFMALLVAQIVRTAGGAPGRSQAPSLYYVGNLMLALLVAGVVWSILEPSLLEFGEKASARLRLAFEVGYNLESLESQNLNPTMIDQVTIIVLAIFFVLQLMVYILGLIRLAAVRKHSADADTRIHLLENEDNLFDLGLYVGLGGTVLSLIMLAMDVVQASLIAAYASTLFGIIFVAILKILHVRPLRRRLILEARGASVR